MEFRLLGTVEMIHDEQVVELGPPQRRLVLAVLAADAGRPVSTESLVDCVWDEAPDGARRTLQVHISRIRRLLATPSTPAGVVRRSGGYLLDIDPDRVDAHRFQRLVNQARDRGRPEAEQLALLGAALELWRGAPLSDLPGRWAARFRQGWQQQYLATVVAWVLACLRAGDSGAVLPRLAELVGQHPLVESLAAAYMRALYAAGRPADALEHYAAVRHRLADELGTDPGPELRQLHRQILSADPALSSPAAVAATGPQPVPRQLPAPPQAFTGRARELGVLDRVIDASTVVISAIDGMAGVGKTALAIHAAHRIADRYPDGQLFIDLHGYTQGLDPVEPADALDYLLRGLGISGSQVPAGLDERGALYRTRLADQRVLIVLDNAASESQVQPLLPGSVGCLVLVTSRRRLAGLDQTNTLSLDTLPAHDAITLFGNIAGEHHLVGQPPELVAELVELCGRLPLAIRVAAARLRAHASWKLTHLVERLRDQQQRLSELQVGQRSVTGALELSYRHLTHDQQSTYRLLGLHPGPELDAYAAAALLDSGLEHARRTLDQLHNAHLLVEPVADRYRFHDLTRTHAAHTATRDEIGPARRAALVRLFDYYRNAASLAVDVAFPDGRERHRWARPARIAVPDMVDQAQATGWLDTELPNLLATTRPATQPGGQAHIWQMSAILRQHLRGRSRYHDADALHRQALAAARDTGHLDDQLDPLLGLGDIYWLQGTYQSATEHFERALRVARAIGNPTGELEALSGLGRVHLRQGRYKLAIDHFEPALQVARVTGSRKGEVDVLSALGHVYWLRGRYEMAAAHFEQALQVARITGNRSWEVDALAGLGHTHRLQGRYEQAADYYRQVLRMGRGTGFRPSELVALIGLGDVHRRQRLYAQATRYYEQLLRVAEEIGDRNWKFEAWQGLGRLYRATSDAETAIAHHDRALALASELGQPVDQARALDGLAHAHHALRRPEQACQHWQTALEILTGLGVNHTDDEEATVEAIRGHLDHLGPAGPPP